MQKQPGCTAKQNRIKTYQQGLISDSGQANWNVVIGIKLVRTRDSHRSLMCAVATNVNYFNAIIVINELR